MKTAHDILEFWFAQAGPDQWFTQSDAFDARVRAQFEATALALANNPAQWADTPDGFLATIIVLDQFPRNMYRDTKAAFAWDALAQSRALVMVDKGWDLKIAMARRAFIYMPFMHAEDLSLQERCVALIDSRLDDADTLHHAKEHLTVIQTFGRFPHRNHVLARVNTAEEETFLISGGYAP